MLISNIILQGSTYFFNLHFIFIFVTLLSPRAHHNIQCNITAIDLSKIKHFLNQFVCNSFRFVKQLLWHSVVILHIFCIQIRLPATLTYVHVHLFIIFYGLLSGFSVYKKYLGLLSFCKSYVTGCSYKKYIKLYIF